MAEKRETAATALRRKAATFYNLFSSPVGEEALRALDEEFNRDDIMVPNDPHSTAYNLGRRDVVIYIRQMIRFYTKENSK